MFIACLLALNALPSSEKQDAESGSQTHYLTSLRQSSSSSLWCKRVWGDDEVSDIPLPFRRCTVPECGSRDLQRLHDSRRLIHL